MDRGQRITIRLALTLGVFLFALGYRYAIAEFILRH